MDNSLTYESVLALIRENANIFSKELKEFRESEEKSYQELREMFKDTEARFKDTEARFKDTERTQKEVSMQIKEVNQMIGGISNSNGQFAENLFVNTLESTLSLNGWSFDSSISDINKYDKALGIREQYDLLLEKEDILAIIEIKYNLKSKDIEKFIDTKIPNYKKLFPKDNRKIVPVLAAISFQDKVLEEAKEHGIYVITIINEQVKVLNSDFVAI